MPKRYGQHYKRRSQIYPKLRTKKLSSGEYLVEHEPSKLECVVFKREPEGDWVIQSRKHPSAMVTGFRKKDKAMEALAKEGPKVIRVA